MARPKKFPECERMTIRMNKADFDNLREVAAKEGREYSEIVRDLIQRYIKRQMSKGLE